MVSLVPSLWTATCHIPESFVYSPAAHPPEWFYSLLCDMAEHKVPFDFIHWACLIAKVQSPACHDVSVTTWQKPKSSVRFQCWFIFYISLPLVFVILCFCSACSPTTACLSLPPWVAGWAFAFLLLPQTACWGDMARPPSSVAPCQAVLVWWVHSILRDFRVTAQSWGTIPTAHSPEALPDVIICGWPSSESLGKWSFWLGQMHRAGKQRRDGVWGGSWEWWHMVGGDAEGYCQKQNVWQLLGTDLHCKYHIFHSNIKLESKASVLMVGCCFCSSCWQTPWCVLLAVSLKPVSPQ